MTPDVDALVVEHEKTATDLPRAIEIDAVAPLNVLVVNQVLRSRLDVANEGL